ncbi:MAG: PEP/pyruvate-binding domain-containing protein [Candidatus Omnitrophica bacterium]|nr:PEP/pyruvate-binding domain-containing protein [Candidatus Omnitrophota bacterium]
MISTGIDGLDEILTGLRKGDNVVWQIDDIKHYLEFVTPFVERALGEKKKVIYMRFASHKPLFKASDNIKTYNLNARGGFELFATQVNNIITLEGEGAYYVFDCLSDLQAAWATDLMIGNFFMVTCPYLYELNTITYFSILRDKHSFKTIARIRETTQLLIDVYHFKETTCIHPLKAWNRYSRTMFLPHLRAKEKFVPVADSADASKLLSYISEKGVESAKRQLDYWDLLFLQAEDLAGEPSRKKEIEKMCDELCRIMVTKDKRIMSLAKENFSLEDLLSVKARLIGTGYVGGKTVGMLLSRKILLKDRSLEWQKFSEPHDSFYIGSDVFYTYIVQNGWWKLRMQQRTEEGYFETARLLKEKMLYGSFPDEIMEKFQQMIEYFGTSPIIVRSSSLLEDGFGNAFAGKYESVFCANQGTPEERYIKFAEAVRRIYASTMSEEALAYRLKRGLHKRDEQMALLVQRVSGAYHKNYFFPDLAGVGISYNTYVWNDKMDSKAGMLRLVFGLGTRAVNRVEGDYPRIVALDAPLLTAHAGMKEARRFCQHDVDLIDIRDNSLKTVSFNELMNEDLDLKIRNIGVVDYEMRRKMEERGLQGKEYWIMNMDAVLSDDNIINFMKKVLKKLEKTYDYPVDVEFTINFSKDDEFKINLLQCRPLQTHGLGKKIDIPEEIKEDAILFESKGYFLGGNISQPIKRLVYVNPKGYNELPMSGKYDIARIVGNLNKEISDKEIMPVLLLGPGRWGTSTPSLGVPVSFFEINNVTSLGEIAFAGGNLMPELSFGTHFFQDLVESKIFYVALFPQKEKVIFNDRLICSGKNMLGEILPDAAKYSGIIGVYDVSDRKARIMSDVLTQRVICFFQKI